jgi:protein-S-isoprenylcysteine O-methyltransferase Ste14
MSYADKYKFPMGIAEIFSIFLERLTRNPLYLKSVLGICDEKVLSQLIQRNRFMELFFVTFYAANSLMKLEYWTNNLTIEETNDLYEDLVRRFTGFEMPGRYWMLHHILPESIMYVPSYLFAAVRAAELEKYLRDKFGDKWWVDYRASRKLKEIMSSGARIDLNQFSKLDLNIFMKEIGDN